jgi:hypothetical protein
MTDYFSVLLIAAIFFPPFSLGLRMGFSTFMGLKISIEEIIMALVLILAIYLRVDIGNMVALVIAGFSLGCAFHYVKKYLERRLGASATRYVIIFSMSTTIYLAVVRNNFEVSNIITLLIFSLFIWMVPEIKNKFREIKS